MCRLRLLLAVAGLMICSHRIALSNSDQTRMWRFAVTPFCEPMVSVRFVELSHEGLVEQLSLRHRLAFDGTSYESDLIIPELESFVVTAGPGRFRWRNLNGDEIQLESNKIVNERGQGWQIDQLGENLVIKSEDGDVQYVYHGCKLRGAVVRGRRYTIEYGEGKEMAIDVLHEGGRQKIIAVRMAETDGLYNIWTEGGTFTVSYDENNKVMSCRNAETGDEILSATYLHQLVKRVTLRGSEHVYEWGQSIWDDYARPVNPMPPVVTSDSLCRYRTLVNWRNVRVEFIDRKGGLRGYWSVDRVKNTIRVEVGS